MMDMTAALKLNIGRPVYLIHRATGRAFTGYLEHVDEDITTIKQFGKTGQYQGIGVLRTEDVAYFEYDDPVIDQYAFKYQVNCQQEVE